MGKSLADLTAEIREINVEHGWRPAEGGPGTTTFGDYIALLHSEISEALEAFRDHGVSDATAVGACGFGDSGCDIHPHKPEGVGSELADVLIRLLDMCDVFGPTPFDMDCELADVEPLSVPEWARSFGDHLAWLHFRASELVLAQPGSNRVEWKTAHVLRALITVAERHGIDLTAEVERKIAYNRTRPFRHGGRNL